MRECCWSHWCSPLRRWNSAHYACRAHFDCGWYATTRFRAEQIPHLTVYLFVAFCVGLNNLPSGAVPYYIPSGEVLWRRLQGMHDCLNLVTFICLCPSSAKLLRSFLARPQWLRHESGFLKDWPPLFYLYIYISATHLLESALLYSRKQCNLLLQIHS